MRRLVLPLLAASALAACSKPAETSSAVSAPPPAATPSPAAPAVTYPITTVAALQRWSALDADAVASADDSDPSCSIRLSKALSVRICGANDQVVSMTATARPGASPQLLDQALDATIAIIAPDTTAADRTRVHREAAEALARGGSMLCPTTRCFRLSPLGEGWVIGASANT